MKCFKCGNVINDGVQYCPECGCKIERSCKNCGTLLSDNDKFCPACGLKQIVEPKIKEEQHMSGKEEVSASLIDRIINLVLSSQDMKGMTDDTYRNELVKKVFVYNVAALVITILAFFRHIVYTRYPIFWKQ